MSFSLSHKIELVPNKSQVQYLMSCCGCARFAYNWALTEWKRQWEEQKPLPKEERKFISEGDLRKQLNSIKKEKFPFLLDVTKYAPQEAIKQLGIAFKRFFKGKGKVGYPTYRKKFVDDRFSIGNDQVKVDGHKVRLPKIGWIKMREAIRFPGKIQTIAISRKADRWFISFTVKVDDHTHHFKQHAENQGEVVGLDAGLTSLAVLSNGEKFDPPHSLKQNLKKLRRANKALARKKRGSNNRSRARRCLARLHRRIENIRLDYLHKLTSSLTDRFKTIVVETLNVKGLMRGRHARSWADASVGEMKRQLAYKAKLRGGEVISADRFFPSTQLCSCCGWRNKKLTINDRSWTCHECHAPHDRDVNAALNLRNYAASYAVKASGEISSGLPAA